MGEELLCYDRADRVEADILGPDGARAVAVEAGGGVGAARIQLAAQDVALGHGEIIAGHR